MRGLVLKPYVGEICVAFDESARGMARAFTAEISRFTVDEYGLATEVFFELRPLFPNDKKHSRVFLDQEQDRWYYDYHLLGTHLEPVTVTLLHPGVTQEELERETAMIFGETGQLPLPLE